MSTTALARSVLAPLVLVVDDSLTVRRVTQRMLLRDGYRVVLAKDGLEALERLAEQRPAVVLSDIEMPRMDGFDLVRNIRSDARLRDARALCRDIACRCVNARGDAGSGGGFMDSGERRFELVVDGHIAG